MARTTEDDFGVQAYKVVGTRPIRHDGMDKVTGRAIFGADVRLPGLLHGKVLRSPHAHARIRSIDLSAAEAMEGVRGVVSGRDLVRDFEDKAEDLGEEVVRLKYLLSGILAQKKVLFHGHPVAAVAAVNAHVAEEALALIEVDYEVLPPVLDVLKAMEEGAPLLHEDLMTESLDALTKRSSNVSQHFQHRLGDVEKGFAQADVIVEREFETGMVHQGYIEPQNATALWNPDGTLTVWTSNQGHFGVRDQLSKILDLPVSRIKVVPAEIGGGFGGKIKVYLEPVAALLSRKTGSPVKMVMTRTEVIQATGPTSGSYIRARVGAKGGKLIAAQAYLAYEAGAFPGSPIGAGARCMFAPYHIENLLIDAYEAVVNKPSTSAYRAPGASNAAFASETVIDEICDRLAVDPLEFRLKNSAREGTRIADGVLLPRVGHETVVKTALESEHYRTPLVGPNRGRGVASGFWHNGGGVSSAMAAVNTDGSVTLVEGSVDIGGTRTSSAMQLAEVLGIPAEDVNPTVGDTAGIGFTQQTGGSRTTFATGWACYKAALDVKRQMIERAAATWEIPEEDIVYADGRVRSKSDPSKRMTFKELAVNLHQTGGPVIGRATVNMPGGTGPAYSLTVVDVEVDPDTGKVEILRCTMVQDAGKAVHPSYVEGQMQGGMAQGIGWALNEEYVYDEQGKLTNASFLDYRMPTCLDLPMVDTIIVEVPNKRHPFGVRGVGEVPIVSPPPAVANAIYNAIGVRMDVLPMSPGRILQALWRKGEGDGRKVHA